MAYYCETKRITSTEIKRIPKFSDTKDELLLVLMRLRQLDFIHCSNIFKRWIRLLSKTVGKLEVLLPKESVMEVTQKSFKTDGQEKLR